MKKRAFKRDWEMTRIFLILAVLTAVFVWGIQGLILTPATTGHNPNYMMEHPTPSGRVPDTDAVHASVLGRTVGVESRFLSVKQILSKFRFSSASDRSKSSEAEDSHNPPSPLLRE